MCKSGVFVNYGSVAPVNPGRFIPVFPLRLITRKEVMRIIEMAEEMSGVKIKPRCFFDRSIMTGRHLETRDYNANAPDLRLPINSLFEHTIAMLASQEKGEAITPELPPFYPDSLRDAIETMQLVIETAGKLQFGDPRANMIEQYLGYSLRRLEMDLQPGTGMGHGLVGVFEISK